MGRKNRDRPALARLLEDMPKRKTYGTSCLTPEQFVEMLAAWGGRCAYCREEIMGRACAEHVEPISRGGLDVPENIVPSCVACNASKGNMLLLEWVGYVHGLLGRAGKGGQRMRMPTERDPMYRRVPWSAPYVPWVPELSWVSLYDDDDPKVVEFRRKREAARELWERTAPSARNQNAA